MMSKPRKRSMAEELSTFLKYRDLVRQYCALAALPEPSHEETARMLHILELAETDRHLDFWIQEADHFLAHELGFSDAESVRSCGDILAKLGEFLPRRKTPRKFPFLWIGSPHRTTIPIWKTKSTKFKNNSSCAWKKCRFTSRARVRSGAGRWLFWRTHP